MKKSLRLISSIVLLIAFVVTSFGFTTISVKSIKLNTNNIILQVGKTYKLKVSFTPANTTQKLLNFSTGNNKIATIDQKGNIKAIGIGKTVITVVSSTNKKVLAKCNVNVESKLVKLKWILRIPEQKDSGTVLTEVNKQLKEKINATLDIFFISPAAYVDKTKLMIAAAEQFDLMWTSASYQFYENVARKAYVAMDDLISKYATEAVNQLPKGFLQATTINGKIYAFPNYQIAARQSAIVFRKDIIEKYNFDVSKITSLEDCEPLFEKMKAGENSIKNIFTLYSGLTTMDALQYLGLEQIGAASSPGVVDIKANSYKVQNITENPKYIKLLKTLRRWQEKGYINKNLALAPNQEELIKTGNILSWGITTNKPGGDAEIKARYNLEPVTINLVEPYVSTGAINGTLQAISRTSNNPERAMMLINLLTTDKVLYNTLAYGVEGKHYIKKEANVVEPIKDSGYAPNVNWMLGNQLNAYLLPGVASDNAEKTDKMNKQSLVSPILGFNFISDSLKTEIAQCSDVNSKYSALAYGMLDVESALTTWKNELKAAGADKIIAEKQRQLDEWVKANNKK